MTTTSLFVKRGFDRTTTRELSQALGWSKGRLYQYVGSKDDLMNLLIKFFTERDNEFMDTATTATSNLSPVETLITTIRIYIEKNDRYQDLYKFITHVTVNLDHAGRQRLFESARRVKDYFETLLIRGVELGEFQTNNTEIVALSVLTLGDTWAMRRWILKRRYSMEEFIREETENILLQLGVRSSSVASKSGTIAAAEAE